MLVFFGIQPNFKTAVATHYYIMVSIISNPLALTGYAFIFTLYFLRCYFFIRTTLSQEAFSFNKILNRLSPAERFPFLLPVATALLLPVLLYSICIVAVAITSRHYFYAGAGCLALFVSIGGLTLLFSKGLSYASGHSFLNQWLKIKITPGLVQQLGSFLLQKQIKVIFFLKAICFVLLYFLVIKTNSLFDRRMLWLVYTLGITSHYIIIYKCFYFLENELSFYRVLPLKITRIMASLFAVYCMLYLPEMWALRAMGLIHHDWSAYILMILLAPALMVLLHALLYMDELNLNDYLPMAFGCWLVCFFAGFTNIQWLLLAIIILLSILVFVRFFRKFEKKATVEKLE
ncbi:hypothetical protein GCM10027516_36330 [Niabella aquatica]